MGFIMICDDCFEEFSDDADMCPSCRKDIMPKDCKVLIMQKILLIFLKQYLVEVLGVWKKLSIIKLLNTTIRF